MSRKNCRTLGNVFHKSLIAGSEFPRVEKLSNELSEFRLLALKKVLARHVVDCLTKRGDAIWQTEGSLAEDMEQWLNEEYQ